jgi:hypothetical protein
VKRWINSATLENMGCPINIANVMATALGIVKNPDCNLLCCHGGEIDISQYWGKNFLSRIGYVK